MSIAAEFASNVLHALSTAEIRKKVTNDASDDHTAPVSRSSLQHVSATLERGIADVKYQMEAHVTAHFEHFKTQAEQATAIISETRELSEELERLNREVEDAEEGLYAQVQRVLKEQDGITTDLAVVDLAIDVSRKISESNTLFGVYDDQIARSQYTNAFASATKMNEVVKSLPTWDSVAILDILTQRNESIAEDIRSRLEYIVSQALSIELEQGRTTIRVNESVSAPGLGPEPVKLSTALSAIDQQHAEKAYLQPFARMLYKRVIDPLLKDSRWKIDADAHPRGPLHVVYVEGPYTAWPSLPQGALFRELEKLFRYLQTSLDFGDHTNHAEALFRVMGTTFWPQISAYIIGNYLQPMVPDTVESLNAFEPLAEDCMKFEAEMKRIGLVPHGGESLVAFCKDLESHYVTKRHFGLMNHARVLITAKDYTTVVLKPPGKLLLSNLIDLPTKPVTSTEVDPALQKGLFILPPCVITNTAKKVMDLAKEAVAEAQKLSPPSKSRLQRSARAILDFYRASVPAYSAQRLATIPQMPMVLQNDCMYFAHELLVMTWRDRGVDGTASGGEVPSISFVDLVGMFKMLGERAVQDEMVRQKTNLNDIIESAERFDVLNDHRRDIVERVIKQLVHHLTLLSNVWKPVLPPAMYINTISTLISHCTKLVSLEVLYLVDIGEQESRTLHGLLTSLANGIQPLTSPFKPQDVVEDYDRFYNVTRILDASFADIMGWFRNGELTSLERREIVGLVRALFADTPLRRANLEEIGG
ncbi:Centromere/kinetochore Zw10-domain-containing protein [Fimicolochytrium jonesii]|uniref:Centromere/kinetochore Zw10-domain-containing protein n=1 Tax=Fimicolochytrium jonesii TaxID=1396493 RepID=UPI0022FE8267|nr:Centromere/kinetochore Zw10-domain-containing protein [Fimicolochytrium jonesii]KAI8817988.1 Centromere/kinetochore Zw10-domain-containing protein [Fimicolochytrium jonesii]